MLFVFTYISWYSQKTVPAGVYWTGDILEANHLGFKCPQKAMFGSVPSGDEDCLNLNVYTPTVSGKYSRTMFSPLSVFFLGTDYFS